MGGSMEKKHKVLKNYMHHNDISDSCESSSDEHVGKQREITTKPVKSDGENSTFHSKIKIGLIKFNKINHIKQEERVKIKKNGLPKFESNSAEEEQSHMTSEEAISQVIVATSSAIEAKHVKEQKFTQPEKHEMDTKNSLPKKNNPKKIKIIPDPQKFEESKRKRIKISKNVSIKEERDSDDELEQCSPKKKKHEFSKIISEKLQVVPVKGSKKKLRDSLAIPRTVLYSSSENIVIKQETDNKPEMKQKLKKRASPIASENTEEAMTLKMHPSADTSDSDSQCEMLEFSDTEGHENFKIGEEQLDEIAETSTARDEYFFQLLSQSDIVITREIPMLHTMTPDVTRHPSKEVRQEIVKSGVPWARGRFSPDEEKIVRRNWKRLCVRYNLPDCPEVFGRWRNKMNNTVFRLARKKAILFLAQGLPDRTLVQVYHNFLSRLGAPTKGRFQEHEELIVEAFRTEEQYKDLSQHFLGSVLGRDPSSIWRYMTKLTLKEKSKSSDGRRVKWTLDLCETFIKILLRLVNERQNRSPESLDLEVLRCPIDIDIWRKLGKEMNLTPLQVKVQWLSKLYVQIFVTEPIYLTALRYKLLEVLQKKNYKSWQSANWKDVTAHFPNYTSLFLWRIFYRFAKQFGKSDLFSQFNALVNHLHERIVLAETPLRNRKLRGLMLDDQGNLHFKS